ncbi:hypothetical protein R6Q59_016165 [Mikania micrantha]
MSRHHSTENSSPLIHITHLNFDWTNKSEGNQRGAGAVEPSLAGAVAAGSGVPATTRRNWGGRRGSGLTATCTLKVNIHCDGCKRKVKKILQNIEGVYIVGVNSEHGTVTVSGNVDPSMLIKKLAKRGKLAHILVASKQNHHINDLIKNIQIKSDGKIKNQDPQQLKGFQDLKLAPKLVDIKLPPDGVGGKDGQKSFDDEMDDIPVKKPTMVSGDGSSNDGGGMDLMGHMSSIKRPESMTGNCNYQQRLKGATTNQQGVGNESFQPLMFGRLPPATSYIEPPYPPYSYPQAPHGELLTHYSSDENNTSSCNVM